MQVFLVVKKKCNTHYCMLTKDQGLYVFCFNNLKYVLSYSLVLAFKDPFKKVDLFSIFLINVNFFL